MDLGSLPEFVRNPDPTKYKTGSYLVLDFETTNLYKGSALNPKNSIVLAAAILVDSSGTKRIPITQDFNQVLSQLLAQVDFFVAHNAKFEIQWLMRLEAWRPMPVYDTMLAERIIAGNRNMPLDLDSVAKRRLGRVKGEIVSALMEAGVCPSDMPQDLLMEYCQLDVELTHDIFKDQLGAMEGTRLLPIVYTRCLFTPVLADIESNGMTLDSEKVEKRYREYSAQLAELRKELDECMGGANPASPKQVAAFLYDTLGFAVPLDYNGNPITTPSGARPTGAEVVHELVANTPEQKRFKDLFSKYGTLKVNTDVLAKLNKCCTDAKIRGVPPILYAQFTQHITQTGRTSSRGTTYKLQFQNFNRDFKDLFTHRFPGWKVGEGDGRQLEFRVAAHLGRDEVAGADIRNPDFDVHYQTAERISGKPRSAITKQYRTAVKPKTFRPLYAGSAGTPAERKYYAYFQHRYSGIYNTQVGWTHTVAASKKLETEWGYVFYWPGCKMLPSGKITNATNIFNYPIQAFATADIIPIGMVCMYYRMMSMNMSSFLVNTVHDSIVGEVKEEEENLFRGICHHSLTYDTFEYLDRCYKVQFTIPLGAETKIGTHWGKGKEEKFDVDPKTMELIHLN